MHRSMGGESQFWISMDDSALRLFGPPVGQINGEQWHEVASCGKWETGQILQEHREAMFHSTQCDYHPEGRSLLSAQKVSFKLDRDLYAFLAMDHTGIGRLSVWATTPERAQQHHSAWRTKFLKPPKRRRKEADFNVLSLTQRGLETQQVPIVRKFLSKETDLALHYGEDFPAWEEQFIRALKSHISGVTILRGEPGTGKTSFIRHLMHKLRRTHRFYYLPVNQAHLLSSPELVEFWIDQSRIVKDMTKVIIIEDAELLMATRGKDNQNHVSNLLNISDGLLGEFLKMHLICTINCEIDKLDPAIRRPGRLRAYRQFHRLSHDEASRLALAKRLKIPVQASYTLAEIYNEQRPVLDPSSGRRVGFG